MRKEQISQSQAYILMIIFILGTSLALVISSESQQDTWISMLIALILAIPIVIILGILAIYILKSGLEVIARVNKFIIPLLIFIISITLIIVIPKSDINNFLPMLEN